jgi:hypothetical protein
MSFHLVSFTISLCALKLSCAINIKTVMNRYTVHIWNGSRLALPHTFNPVICERIVQPFRLLCPNMHILTYTLGCDFFYNSTQNFNFLTLVARHSSTFTYQLFFLSILIITASLTFV